MKYKLYILLFLAVITYLSSCCWEKEIYYSPNLTSEIITKATPLAVGESLSVLITLTNNSETTINTDCSTCCQNIGLNIPEFHCGTKAFFRETEQDVWEAVQFQDETGVIIDAVIFDVPILTIGKSFEKEQNFNFTNEGQYRFELIIDIFDEVYGIGDNKQNNKKSYSNSNNTTIININKENINLQPDNGINILTKKTN